MDILKDLDPAQVEAVKATEGAVLVLAGAGSGKTRVLTYKAAYLLDYKGVKPENILLSTFTNKAANEMKERIFRLLGSQAIGRLGKKKNLTAQKPNSSSSSSSLSDLGVEDLSLRAEGPTAQLPFIGTFHAFCAKLLRIDGKYIGIPAGYLIYDDDDSLSLVKK